MRVASVQSRAVFAGFSHYNSSPSTNDGSTWWMTLGGECRRHQERFIHALPGWETEVGHDTIAASLKQEIEVSWCEGSHRKHLGALDKMDGLRISGSRRVWVQGWLR